MLADSAIRSHGKWLRFTSAPSVERDRNQNDESLHDLLPERGEIQQEQTIIQHGS
jgi:hypothetical protein